MLYLISYELNAPGQKYDKLYKILEKENAIRIMTSTWLVDSAEDIHAWEKKFEGVFDHNDAYLFVDVTESGKIGTLEQDTADWVQSRCDSC